MSRIDVVSLVKKATPSVVSIYTVDKNDYVQSQGTGFIFTTDGFILTNAHVIADGNPVKVKFADGTATKAKEVLNDPFLDIAVLDVDGTNYQPLAWAKTMPSVGDPLVVIGNAYGYSNSVTFGIVSGLDRPDPYHYPSLQTDAVINHGNSGGPILNAAGEVIAIATWGELKGQTEGLAFGIPIKQVSEAFAKLDASRGVVRPWLGISAEEPYWSRGGLPNDVGLMITGVSALGAGSAAGLRLYDWITQVNGKDVNYLPELRHELEKYKPGETITLRVERKNSVTGRYDVLNLKVTLGEYSVAVKAAIPSNYSRGDSDDIF